jgi:hypothetical protein
MLQQEDQIQIFVGAGRWEWLVRCHWSRQERYSLLIASPSRLPQILLAGKTA